MVVVISKKYAEYGLTSSDCFYGTYNSYFIGGIPIIFMYLQINYINRILMCTDIELH
jgi:hypothetical protein